MGIKEEPTVRLAPVDAPTPQEGLERNRARLIVVAGDSVGCAFPVTDGAVLGRGEVAVRVLGGEVSRRHAQFRVHDGRYFVRDLASMNGTHVNGSRILEEREILEGDKVQVGAIVLRFALFDDLDERFQARMFESALRDPLTRAFNRKYLEERLDSEFAYSLRHGTPLALLLFDVDHFKNINDSLGHLAGDSVLTQLADHVLRVIRAEDVLARYGGEEFAIVSRGIDRDAAQQFAERLRASVERGPFVHSARETQPPSDPASLSLRDTGRVTWTDPSKATRVPLTISVGAATMPDPEIGQPIQLLARADDALYRAKAAGRNRVRVHGLV